MGRYSWSRLKEFGSQYLDAKGATALVDGNSGYSQLALLKARQLGLEKVREFGTAVIAGRNCL